MPLPLFIKGKKKKTIGKVRTTGTAYESKPKKGKKDPALLDKIKGLKPSKKK